MYLFYYVLFTVMISESRKDREGIKYMILQIDRREIG